MIDHRILIDTAALYNRRAKNNVQYVFPSNVLNNAIRQLGIVDKSKSSEINNSDQFIVIRTPGIAGEPDVIRHPLDLVDNGIASGVESLRKYGMLDTKHTCLIVVPRGSLTCTFTLIYEVVRQCDWSVLPLGGSDDSQDISKLCNTYKVDTIFIAADLLESVFTDNLIEQFDSVKSLQYVSGIPSQKSLDNIKSNSPQIEALPFLYMSNSTGPIGLPTRNGKNNEFEALQNILIEVESSNGEINLNGSGRFLISVLGLEQPIIIRRDIGDFGTLITSEDGRQVVQLQGSRSQ